MIWALGWYLKVCSSTAGSPGLELFCDNKAATDVAYNPEHHTRMKHVERRHFFVRELVEEHRLRVPYVETDKNLADFFTKALPARKFFTLRDKIMNVPSGLGDHGYGGALSEERAGDARAVCAPTGAHVRKARTD